MMTAPLSVTSHSKKENLVILSEINSGDSFSGKQRKRQSRALPKNKIRVICVIR